MAGKRGHPRKFKSGEQLIELFRAFCRYVVEEREYGIIPSQTNFCEWLEGNFEAVDRKTIYLSLEHYYPTVKRDYYAMVADVLAQGAMTGHYQPTMTIFTLKNWCDWKDKQEVDLGNKDGKPFAIATEQEAVKALEALGYAKRD